MENLLLGFLIGEDQTSLSPLSKREKECLQHMKAGHTAKEIARLMTISYRTVENHVEKIKTKLGCQNQTQIIKLLHESYKKIIGKLPGNVWWKNKNLIYLGCNDRVIHILGLASHEDFIGKTDYDLWEKPIADKLQEADLYVLKTGESINLEETIVESDGRHVIMLTNKSPFYDARGNIAGIVGTSTDISERKKMEEKLAIAIEEKLTAETANNAKTEFLENMRHDIRTPLEGIINFANTIKEEANNSKIQMYADSLISSGNALSEFLNEILETIHAASGKIPLCKNKFDLKKCLAFIFQLNQTTAKQKNLAFQLNYDTKIPIYLIGDSKRIQRVILELVTNALKFTHEGSVKISAQLAKKENRNVVIKIIVADTGIGIPADQQQEIFVRFKRLSASQNSIYSGTGLGLALIKQFIDELNGEIYVESILKKGTTFTCLLPLKETLLDDELGADSK